MDNSYKIKTIRRNNECVQGKNSIQYPVFGNKKINAAIMKVVGNKCCDIEFDAQYPSREIVSLTFPLYCEDGGVHPNHGLETLSFNLRDGSRLKFDDLFTNPAQTRKKLGLIAAKKMLADKEMERDQAGDIFSVSFNTIKAIRQGKAEFFKDFQIVPDGIKLVFPAWRVGGEIVEISLAEMTGIERKSGIWEH